MPGLDPGIHGAVALDCRVEPGNDMGERVHADIEGVLLQKGMMSSASSTALARFSVAWVSLIMLV